MKEWREFIAIASDTNERLECQPSYFTEFISSSSIYHSKNKNSALISSESQSRSIMTKTANIKLIKDFNALVNKKGDATSLGRPKGPILTINLA